MASGGSSSDGQGNPSPRDVYVNKQDILEEYAADGDGVSPVDEEDRGEATMDMDMEEGEATAEEEEEEEEEEGKDDAVHVFSGHHDSVYAVAASAQSMGLVATGGGDDSAYLWRIGQVEEAPVQLKGHSDSVASLAFSNDGALLATGGLDGLVYVWDAETGAEKHKLEGPGEAIEWVSWHPRGRILLAGSEDFTTWMWNADTGATMGVLAGHNGAVTCGQFTPDGKSIVTGSADGSLRVWQPRSGECATAFQGHPFHAEGLTSLHVSADSALALSGSTDKTARLVHLHNNKVLGTLEGHQGSVEAVGLCPGLPLAATGGLDGKLLVWDLQSLTVRNVGEHEDGVVRLLWHPTAPLIYTASLDGAIRVWDGRTGTCERKFEGHKDNILDMAVTADGSFILSGSDDQTARVYGL